MRLLITLNESIPPRKDQRWQQIWPFGNGRDVSLIKVHAHMLSRVEFHKRTSLAVHIYMVSLGWHVEGDNLPMLLVFLLIHRVTCRQSFFIFFQIQKMTIKKENIHKRKENQRIKEYSKEVEMNQDQMQIYNSLRIRSISSAFGKETSSLFI